MGKIEVDALYARILGHDHIKDCAGATADVDQSVESLKAIVRLDNFLHEDDGVTRHCPVEHLSEVRVLGHVLERCLPTMSLAEWNPTLQHCIFEVIPDQ